MRDSSERLLLPLAAILAALALFGLFCAAFGANPFAVYGSIYTAAFGSWYSWQNTLVRAAPLLLCGLCTALPARAGVIVIGNEGAVVMGGLGAIAIGLPALALAPWLCLLLMALAAMVCGGLWIGFSVALQHYRGVNAVISGLLLNYIAIALMNQLIEGPMRDPSSLNKPASYPLTADHRLPYFSGTHVHYGLVFGIAACLVLWFLLERTTGGFAIKIAGGNVRAAKLGGLAVGKLVVSTAFLGGACAGLAGMVEVAAVHGRANESLNAGYGYVGILVAFLARQAPLGVLAVSLLVGGVVASGGMLQRAHDLPDAAITVFEGILFLVILLSETAYGRGWLGPARAMQAQPDTLGTWGVAVALAGGAARGSIPYMFVSLGECLTETSGKINLGMEGVLLMGAMTAFGVSDHTGSPWMGVLAAGLVGALLGLIHAVMTAQARVNDVATGIAMILFGSGLAFFFGKRFVAPMAPQLPLISLGDWSGNPAVQSALRISPLFFLGIACAFLLHWLLTRTRWGLKIRAAGDDPQAARALGIDVNGVRAFAITAGACLAAIGGAHLTLYFPGIWSEGISVGQGLMAVALVIFARWSPRRCLATALLFGGAQALGPSLQSLGVTGYYHLFNASPYVLTLVLMIVTCAPDRRPIGMPGALGKK